MVRNLMKGCVVVFVVLMSTAVGAVEKPRLPGQMLTPKQAKTMADVTYECPMTLSGVHVTIESSFSPPGGWTPKNIPTTYSSLTLTRSHHAVVGTNLWCTYAGSAQPGALRTTSMSRPAPAGKTCTADAGFRFTCK